LRLRKTGGGWLAGAVVVVSLSFVVAHGISFKESRAVERFASANTPIDLSTIPDGTYQGIGRGNNGDVKVAVTIKAGGIADVKMLDYREAVYAYDEAIGKIIGSKTTDVQGLEGFVFRNRESLTALQNAIEEALIPTLPDYPAPGEIAKATFFITENRVGRIAINTLAILFIAIITFDFFLQPTLSKGTGQSLNCYNCQACVGACPVKMVAGDPFPMIMVIESRAGNYEKVAELAKYCVGCGKCAAKCPVGNSGPSVASSSFLLWKQEIQREKRKEQSRLRNWPTLDNLSREQGDE
jgi:ferredoxin